MSIGQEPLARNEAGPDSLRLNVDFSPEFRELDFSQQLGALRAQHSLNAMAQRGYLDLSECRRMFEFGPGPGGSTYVLAKLALLNGGSVEAAELSPVRAGIVANSGFLPPDALHVGDGGLILDQLTRDGHKFDLVAAFMFGPDFISGGTRIRRLLPEIGPALADDGKFLVSSDPHTMEYVRAACHDAGIGFDDYYPPLARDFDLDEPDKMDTIVVPRAGFPGNN